MNRLDLTYPENSRSPSYKTAYRLEAFCFHVFCSALFRFNGYEVMSGSAGDLFQAQVSTYVPLLVVAASLVALRIFVKVKIVRNFGPEDYACLFALVRSITQKGCAAETC